MITNVVLLSVLRQRILRLTISLLSPIAGIKLGLQIEECIQSGLRTISGRTATSRTGIKNQFALTVKALVEGLEFETASDCFTHQALFSALTIDKVSGLVFSPLIGYLHRWVKLAGKHRTIGGSIVHCAESIFENGRVDDVKGKSYRIALTP
jgi:hypothetical protein